MFFYTIGLAADQWMWCVFIGIGSLLWGQVCDVVPSSHITQFYSLSRASSPLVSFSACCGIYNFRDFTVLYAKGTNINSERRL